MMNSSQNPASFNKPHTQEVLAEIIYEQRIICAFQKFRENGIEPILIKGWSIAQFYPKNKKRRMSDVDLCVPPKDFEKAKKIEAELGFPRYSIDLHKGLRHLDKLSFEDLLNNSRIIKLRDAEIRILRPEDNFRVTCVHWLNDGGAEKEKLWDVYYLVENRPPDFDWDRFLNAAGRKRRQWLICTIALAHRYLNLNVDETPIADEIKNPATLPNWLIKALEKEWNNDMKIAQFDNFIYRRDWRLLAEQLRRRFPPNAITASIETEAPFDNKPRLPYQLADIALRIPPSLGRIVQAVLRWVKILPDKKR